VKVEQHQRFLKGKKREVYIYISKQKYHTVGPVLKSNRKIVETKAKSILLTNIDIELDQKLGFYSLAPVLSYISEVEIHFF
jgi:hypothetical protein